MISRRNYLIILIVMGIVFFLFQFSQIVTENKNEFTINEYKELKVVPNKSFKQTSVDAKESGISSFKGNDYTLFIGDIDTNIGSIVGQWTNYTKRDLAVGESIEYLDVSTMPLPDFLIVDSNYVDFAKDVDFFFDITDKGVSVVFCNMPDVKFFDDKELCKLMGVSYVREPSVEVEGLKLFEGFLLGGETIYKPEKAKDAWRQDLDLEMPWFVTSGGTKTYMVGIMDEYFDDYEYGNELLPAVIWRNSLGKAQVFCVLGDYMSETTGLGILSAMINELSSYQIYPVVNAQNTLVIDFPLLANENDENINKIYSRSLDSFQSQAMWPTLISLSEKYGMKYTCFMTPKYNYSDSVAPEYDYYVTYLKLFKERAAEIGMSLEHASGISLLDKLEYDSDYYDVIDNRYDITSAFLDLKDEDELNKALANRYLKNVRTIACDADIDLPILSYITDDITLQSLTSNTKKFTYSKDLMLKSIETVLAYDNAKLSMSDVAWPESVDDQWENIYNDMSSSLATFWKPFRVFDNTTLTESDLRVRTFLNIDYESLRKDDTISLKVTGMDDNGCWFILRTHSEKIDSISGASYTKIEDNAYLIDVESENITIKLAR